MEDKSVNTSSTLDTLERAAEKGVDVALLTDMYTLAWEHAYDVALLVSSDADLIPAVDRLQDRGLKVINATWSGYGHDLAKTCWASFQIDPLVSALIRAPRPGEPSGIRAGQ